MLSAWVLIYENRSTQCTLLHEQRTRGNTYQHELARLARDAYSDTFN